MVIQQSSKVFNLLISAFIGLTLLSAFASALFNPALLAWTSLGTGVNGTPILGNFSFAGIFSLGVGQVLLSLIILVVGLAMVGIKLKGVDNKGR